MTEKTLLREFCIKLLVPAGVLDQDPAMHPQNSIFWDSKAPWYIEPREIPKFSDYS